MKKIALAVAVLLSIAGCHNPKSSTIPTDSEKWESELKAPMQQLSEEDRNAAAAFLFRAKVVEGFGKDTLLTPGLTIGDAIANQKKWEKDRKDREDEQESLKKKLLAEQEAIRKQIEGVVTVTVLSKTLTKSDYRSGTYSDTQDFRLGIENKGAKDIVGIKGTVVFYDIFDKEQGRVGFTFDDGIAVGESKTWVGSRDYNQFVDSHKSLANLEEGKYHTKFIPEAIIFKDGTKISTPES